MRAKMVTQEIITALEIMTNAPVEHDESHGLIYNPGGNRDSVYGWRPVPEEKVEAAVAQAITWKNDPEYRQWPEEEL